ncbi:predicted protein [Uncinocarpus reesii 1704]|uniref:Myb-like domain-containing protein n=1 Tax=Uncinocarpus reesii (strain UAMH 1704) TaxID=336963 RepID=C4JJR9_UNCRE|nr:uncharacterized protein UREG_01876 [Uncinocarpus reesii 1704]EEP77027.1 predicted protein [Uncinocarpus reesii 1704]
MPKQTPSRGPRRSAPYPSSKPKTGTSATSKEMNPLRTSAPAAPHTLNPWHAPSSQPRHIPPHIATYPSRLSGAERSSTALPTSPMTPSNTSGPWSPRDDEILLAARAQTQGWNQIQKEHFPSKSSNACRKRYERLIAKRRGSDWNDERIDRLANQYMQMREQTWRPLADAVGENWEDVEKLCLERGARTLLPTLGQHELRRELPEREGRGGSHDSHDEERLSIHNLLQ